MALGQRAALLTFETDGPSTVHAAISDASGRSAMLWGWSPIDEQGCARRRKNGSVEQSRPTPATASGRVHDRRQRRRAHGVTDGRFQRHPAKRHARQLPLRRHVGSRLQRLRARLDARQTAIAVQSLSTTGTSGAYDYHLVIQPASAIPSRSRRGPSQSFALTRHCPRTWASTSDVRGSGRVSNPGMAVFSRPPQLAVGGESRPTEPLRPARAPHRRARARRPRRGP